MAFPCGVKQRWQSLSEWMTQNIFNQPRTLQTWRLWKHQSLLQAQPVPPALQPVSLIWTCPPPNSVLAILLSLLWTQHSTVSYFGLLIVCFTSSPQRQLLQHQMPSTLSHRSALLITSSHLSLSVYQLQDPTLPVLPSFSPLSLCWSHSSPQRSRLLSLTLITQTVSSAVQFLHLSLLNLLESFSS